MSAALERSLPHYQNKSLFSLWMIPEKGNIPLSFISFMMMVFLSSRSPNPKQLQNVTAIIWCYWVSIKKTVSGNEYPKAALFYSSFLWLFLSERSCGFEKIVGELKFRHFYRCNTGRRRLKGMPYIPFKPKLQKWFTESRQVP